MAGNGRSVGKNHKSLQRSFFLNNEETQKYEEKKMEKETLKLISLNAINMKEDNKEKPEKKEEEKKNFNRMKLATASLRFFWYLLPFLSLPHFFYGQIMCKYLFSIDLREIEMKTKIYYFFFSLLLLLLMVIIP